MFVVVCIFRENQSNISLKNQHCLCLKTLSGTMNLLKINFRTNLNVFLVKCSLFRKVTALELGTWAVSRAKYKQLRSCGGLSKYKYEKDTSEMPQYKVLTVEIVPSENCH